MEPRRLVSVIAPAQPRPTEPPPVARGQDTAQHSHPCAEMLRHHPWAPFPLAFLRRRAPATRSCLATAERGEHLQALDGDTGISAMGLSMRTTFRQALGQMWLACAALAILLCSQWTAGAYMASQMRGTHQAAHMRRPATKADSQLRWLDPLADSHSRPADPDPPAGECVNRSAGRSHQRSGELRQRQ